MKWQERCERRSKFERGNRWWTILRAGNYLNRASLVYVSNLNFPSAVGCTLPSPVSKLLFFFLSHACSFKTLPCPIPPLKHKRLQLAGSCLYQILQPTYQIITEEGLCPKRWKKGPESGAVLKCEVGKEQQFTRCERKHTVGTTFKVQCFSSQLLGMPWGWP